LPTISLIVALDSHNLIGKDNHLPWHIPEDLSYFRETTMGHPVIMGKSTWLSLGKPLEGRVNVILTHDKDFSVPGCIVSNSIEQILGDFHNTEIFVIGGASIFKQFLPLAKKLYVTRINHQFEGDTYFPEVDWDSWEIVFFEQKETQKGYSLAFEQWQKKPI
jgi:dihydrofolate reductase